MPFPVRSDHRETRHPLPFPVRTEHRWALRSRSTPTANTGRYPTKVLRRSRWSKPQRNEAHGIHHLPVLRWPDGYLRFGLVLTPIPPGTKHGNPCLRGGQRSRLRRHRHCPANLDGREVGRTCSEATHRQAALRRLRDARTSGTTTVLLPHAGLSSSTDAGAHASAPTVSRAPVPTAVESQSGRSFSRTLSPCRGTPDVKHDNPRGCDHGHAGDRAGPVPFTQGGCPTSDKKVSRRRVSSWAHACTGTGELFSGLLSTNSPSIVETATGCESFHCRERQGCSP